MVCVAYILGVVYMSSLLVAEGGEMGVVIFV